PAAGRGGARDSVGPPLGGAPPRPKKPPARDRAFRPRPMSEPIRAANNYCVGKQKAGGGGSPPHGERTGEILPPPQLLFPDALGAVGWLSTLIGYAVCVGVGVLFAVQAQRERAGAVGGVETLFALSLILIAAVELTSNLKLLLLAAGGTLVLGGALSLTFAS